MTAQVETWPDDGTAFVGLPDDADPTVLDNALAAATDVLWALSGRQYGYRTMKVRPILRRYRPTHPAFAHQYLPFADSAQLATSWMPFDCGSCTGVCGCENLQIVRLSEMAVSIPATGIKVDGETLDASAWELIDNGWLKRLDGGSWPRRQDLNLPDTEANTFSVVCRVGKEPPPLGAQAMSALATEIAKAGLNLACNLPARITSISRQGMSVAMLDPMEFLDNGQTGIYIVDLFLARANPGKLKRRPGIFRADAR